MHSFRLAAVAVLGAVAPGLPTFALDFGPGFNFNAEAELEYVGSDSDTDGGFGFTDLRFGWRGQGGRAVSLGFDLGLQGRHAFEDGADDWVVWGGLVLGTAYGEVTVGNPRPLIDGLPQVPDVGSVRANRTMLDLYTGSAQSALLLTESSLDSYGISLKGDTGSLTYGASLHRIEIGGSAIDALELMAMYDFSRGSVYAAYETFDADDLDAQKLILGGQYAAARWGAGVEFARVDLGDYDGNVFTLYGDYKVTDALIVGLQMVDLEDVEDTTLYGISGRFGSTSGAFAELGAFTATDNDSDAVSASIGYEF